MYKIVLIVIDLLNVKSCYLIQVIIWKETSNGWAKLQEFCNHDSSGKQNRSSQLVSQSVSHTDRKTDRQTVSQSVSHTDRKTDSQSVSHTDRKTDSQSVSQTVGQSNLQCR